MRPSQSIGSLGKRAVILLSPVLEVLPGIDYAGPRVDPVFIVGSGRSGTTLLRRLLMQGGQIHIPPESYVLGGVIRRFSVWRILPWKSATRHVIHEFERHPEFGTWEISARPILAALAQTPARDRALSTIIDALYRFHSSERGTGTTRWGDKTPSNSYCLTEIHRVFPDAKFLHMLRDGCDVVASMTAMGRVRTVEEAAGLWTRAVAAISRFSVDHPDAVLEVRYESLAREPEAVARRVCKWLGVEFTPSMILGGIDGQVLGDVATHPHHANVMNPISASSVGRGRNGLDDPTKRRLQPLLDPTLAAAGYPPVMS